MTEQRARTIRSGMNEGFHTIVGQLTAFIWVPGKAVREDRAHSNFQTSCCSK